MLSPPTNPRRLPLRLISLGVLTLASGAAMQALGVAVPALLAEVTGAATPFGAMARIGGVVCILGLVLAAFSVTTDVAADGPEAEAVDESVPAMTPARTAEWQRRLAENASAPGPSAAPVRSHRIAASLHRAAIVLVAVALGGMLAAAMWGDGSSATVTSAARAAPDSGAPG